MELPRSTLFVLAFTVDKIEMMDLMSHKHRKNLEKAFEDEKEGTASRNKPHKMEFQVFSLLSFHSARLTGQAAETCDQIMVLNANCAHRWISMCREMKSCAAPQVLHA